MTDSRPIGVFDSGVGGLTVFLEQSVETLELVDFAPEPAHS